ncbi:MAG: asparaginase [Clostridia bacterium]|nr:asparaginase [Clostridia bacterium]
MLPKLVEVYRGKLVESVHRGAVVVVDQTGRILEQWGDSGLVTYWRSAAKPVQAVTVVAGGVVEAYGLTGEEIALMTGSHGGETQHVRVIQSILGKLGLGPEHLLCGIHPPTNKEAARELAAQGRQPEVWHHNCSGKHGGMLALAAHLRADLGSYLDIHHPVQQRMLDTVASFAQLPQGQITVGIDGCGVPVYGMPLSNMALAFARLTGDGAGEAARRVVENMLAHPEMVAGTNSFDTQLIKVTDGKVIAKIGAEGVYCVGLVGRGIGLAAKVEDGNTRALPPVVVEFLDRIRVLLPDELALLKSFHQPEVKNHRGEKVGEIKVII